MSFSFFIQIHDNIGGSPVSLPWIRQASGIYRDKPLLDIHQWLMRMTEHDNINFPAPCLLFQKFIE